MSEGYRRVGRGGAGNFYTKQEVEEVKKAAAATTAASSDVESGRPRSSSSSSSLSSLAKRITSSTNPEYVHSGRGGAGNWFKPSFLRSKGLKQQDDDAPTNNQPSIPSTITENASNTANNPAQALGRQQALGGDGDASGGGGGSGNGNASHGKPVRVEGSSKPNYTGGRGGAGNYLDRGAEEEKERVRLEREREEGVGRRLKEKVERDVELGLKRPDKAWGGARE